MPLNGPAVAIAGLRKRYRTGLLGRWRDAVRQVELTLDEGDGLALVGPNGAGKSSVLLVLAGLRRPSAGAVRVLGGSPDDPAVRARLGLLPERPVLRRGVRVIEALTGYARLHGLGRGAADRALERLGLAAWADAFTDRLSQGVHQRVALARALLHEPALLLLDEPLANLDPAAAAIALAVLAEERDRGATILVASHRLADLAPLCGRVARMADGVLTDLGATADVLARLPARITWVAEGRLWTRAVAPRERDAAIDRVRAQGGAVVRIEPIVEEVA